MATYDLKTEVPTEIQAGDIINVTYSGSAKRIVLPKGQYKLECWGAQGGTAGSTSYVGGKGGYSVGTLNLEKATGFLVLVGGQGKAGLNSDSVAVVKGGYNNGGAAGGSSYTSSYTYKGGSGGGGTDFRVDIPVVKARLIVAGGGGGAAYQYTGGYGGGTSGGVGSGKYGHAGTQTAGGTVASSDATNATAGAFGTGGIGAYSEGKNNGGGGGGGWYGGGGGGHGNPSTPGPGGGGSGYVYTSSTATNYPSGCLLNSSFYLTDASTKAGNTSFLSPTGTSETGHSGNGYARITVLDVQEEEEEAIPLSYWKTSASIWKEVKKMYWKHNNEWLEVG